MSAVSEAATTVSATFSLLVMLRQVAQTFPATEAVPTASEKFPLLLMLRPVSDISPVNEAVPTAHEKLHLLVMLRSQSFRYSPLSAKLRPQSQKKIHVSDAAPSRSEFSGQQSCAHSLATFSSVSDAATIVPQTFPLSVNLSENCPC